MCTLWHEKEKIFTKGKTADGKEDTLSPDLLQAKPITVMFMQSHIEKSKNGGNVKEVMEIRLRSKLKSVLIVQYLKILYNRN